MKVFVFVISAFAIFGTLSAAPRDDTDLVEKIQKVVDEILALIPENLGVKDKTFTIPKNALESGEITINEVSVTGLKNLQTKLNYAKDTGRLDYTFDYPDVALVIDFALKLQGLVDVDHHLSVHVDLKEAKAGGYAVVASDQKEVTDLDLLVTLGEGDFDIQGLLNNDELSKEISDYLTKNVAQVLDKINPILEPYVSKILKAVINIALKL